jgi:hypothetical protein
VPATRSAPASHSISARANCATSPVRNPRRTRSRMIARSHRRAGVYRRRPQSAGSPVPVPNTAACRQAADESSGNSAVETGATAGPSTARWRIKALRLLVNFSIVPPQSFPVHAGFHVDLRAAPNRDRTCRWRAKRDLGLLFKGRASRLHFTSLSSASAGSHRTAAARVGQRGLETSRNLRGRP